MGKGFLASCHPYDAGGIYPLQRVPHPNTADHALGRDFSKGQEHKRALEKMRVRQCKIGIVQLDVIVSKNVDVDGTRSPMPFIGSVAAERVFAIEGAREKLVRRQ